MKKISSNDQTLWIDKTLSQQVQTDRGDSKQTIETTKLQTDNRKLTAKGKNYFFEIPFTERFKDKLFTFNKIGNMYKLDDESQSPSIKASLIFNKTKIRKNSCLRSVFKSKKNIVDMKKVTESSRVSIESKDTQRQTKSLDASKVTAVFSKQNKYRYELECSQIKEEEIEQTIVKKPVNLRKIYTPHELKKGKENTRRAIQFESQIDPTEGKKHYQKQFFKNIKSQENSDNDLTQRSLSLLPDLNSRPSEASGSKRLIISTSKRQSANTEPSEQLLPRLKIPKPKKNIPQENQKLYTIR